MAKLKAGRLQREVADACLQYWGGMGFMNETPGQPRLSRRAAALDRRRRRRDHAGHHLQADGHASRAPPMSPSPRLRMRDPAQASQRAIQGQSR